MKLSRNFVLGRMNKALDERLVPKGEYVDAMNIRVGATNDSEGGTVENEKGNSQLTQLEYKGQSLSSQARAIGAYADSANETIYWFVHDPNFPDTIITDKCDMIVSFDTRTNVLTYHVICEDDGGRVNTTLNFDFDRPITGVDLVGDQLFFTDNYNPPRVINVKKSYPLPSLGTDQITEDDISVVKKPPRYAPTVTPIRTASQENFLEDRFICFAYRYKYEDGEYSATSQFSNPSFVSSVFNYSTETGLNEGMANSTNLAQITYNSGGQSVVAVDILFRDMNTGLIKVVEKLNKEELGLIDDTNYTYTFSNSKIFTVLPESEVLRLYDNVPLVAQAQTFVGNRIVYGNYKEGYDLEDIFGNPISLEYYAELVSEDIGEEDVSTRTAQSAYNIDGGLFVPDSLVYIDLDGIDLVQGAVIDFIFRFEHDSFSGGSPDPVSTTTETTITFSYTLPQDFDSAYALGTSTDFLEKIGTAANIQPVATACDGVTLTDIFNCALPATLDTFTKTDSGIDATGDPIRVFPSEFNSEIGFQLLAMRYVDGPNDAYEYYTVTFAAADYLKIGNPVSLHSNRGYEVGILYMDDYNRATTALVSENNTVHVPCGSSDLQNKIKVTIPVNQLAPAWATAFKFCIKQDKENYFNIFSQFFFRDPTSGADYFLLEGQNARKVEEGDELIVKRDTSGATSRCIKTTVLEKKAQEKDFLDPAPVDSQGNTIPVPAGVYMKVRANNFSTDVGDMPLITFGTKSDTAKSRNGGCAVVAYPVNIEDPNTPGTYIDYTIPAGSRITLEFRTEREGMTCAYGLSIHHPAEYVFEVTLTASQDYSSFKSWWEGDNVPLIINSQAAVTQSCVPPDSPLTAAYNSSDLLSSVGQDENDIDCWTVVNGDIVEVQYRFYEDDSGTGEKFLVFSGLYGERPKKKRAKASVNIEVVRSDNLCVFETTPQDALPDVWYEGEQTFLLDSDGRHLCNTQVQTASDPGIADLSFYNCVAFGNGVESYQVRDSISGKALSLGNRVTTTSAKEYRQAHRFADLTYSGVYNNETNVNKLNEFNLGLANFKPLEDTYGSIRKLFSRDTDILVLQEDKISYVLLGKNILSDSTGGSVISSVPEVLGNQVARMEEYGISSNPESFVSWGPDKYFTDAKRAAVIHLKGSSYRNEQLEVISNKGMSPWFRDLFIDAYNTQKLGGYDPFHKEYVLCSNNIVVSETADCYTCGLTKTYLVDDKANTTFCVDVGNLVGDVDIDYNFIDVPGSVAVSATYNNVTTSTGAVLLSGTLTVNKDEVSVDTMDIELSATGGPATLEVTVRCPDAQSILVHQVCISNSDEADQLIHNEYRWTDGSYTSPLRSTRVQLEEGVADPLVSQWDEVTGLQGSGAIPTDGATVSIISNRITPIDNFEFDPAADKFRYLRTSTRYFNTAIDVANLLAASSLATPITGSDGRYEATFTMPSGSDEYLYLIYDYRTALEIELYYSNISGNTACCSVGSTSTYYIDGNSLSTATHVYTDAAMTTYAAIGWYSDGEVSRYQDFNGRLISLVDCDCP